MPDPLRSTRPSRLVMRFEVSSTHDDWVIPEGTVPESRAHDQASELIRALLQAWAERQGLDAQVNRNLALRFDPDRWRLGIDPDVCVLTPSPPEGDDLTSLQLWKSGHHPPMLAVEVVSQTHPNKDYSTVPERHAACGTAELWVFDAQMAGSKAFGGPHRIQVWSRTEEGEFVRTYAGEGPAYSPAVGAWLFAVDEGRKLRIAADEAGTDWWMTKEERERAEKERERAEKERAADERDKLRDENARLRAEVEALRRG